MMDCIFRLGAESRWKKSLGVMVVAGFAAGGGAKVAQGQISLLETVVPIDATLAADGWIGIKLTMVADSASGVVGGWDFKNNISLAGAVVNGVGYAEGINGPLLFSPTETIGISGPLHQAWQTIAGESDPEETPGISVSPTHGATDSAMIAPISLRVGDAPDEDNNLEDGGSIGDFTKSPLVSSVDDDGDGVAYGVGSFLTISAAVNQPARKATQDLAFVIVPAGTGDVYVRGFVLDGFNYGFSFDQVINPAGFGASTGDTTTIGPSLVAPTPEPGTVGVLGVSVLASLLWKRRR